MCVLLVTLSALTTTPPLLAQSIAGLVGLYDFSGNANDTSGNGNHGTASGVTYVSDRNGVPAAACSITYPHFISLPSSVIDGLRSFTLSIWVKFTSFNTNGAWPLNTIFQVANASDDNALNLIFQASDNRFGIQEEGEYWFLFPADSSVRDFQWHHVAVTCNNGLCTLFLDGRLIGTVTIPDLPVSAAAGGVVLGEDQDVVGGAFESNQGLEGCLDEFRIYSRALSDWEVRQLCGSVAYWPFDGNVNDLSGNGNHGVNHGVVFVADRFGITNGAGSFGEDAYVEVPDSLSLQVTGTAITVTVWVYPTNFWPGKSSIVQKMGFPAGSGGYAVGITADGRIQISGVFDTGEWQDVKTASYRVPTNAWSHVAVTYDGQTVRYYLNGALVDSTPFAGHLQASSQPLAVGRITPGYLGEVFYGKIDELQIFDRTLSSAEIAALYSEPRPSIAVSHVRICWDSRTNKNYQVQFRSVLTANEWVNLGSPIPGNGGTQCVTDEIVSPQRFYRVIMVP